MIYYAHSQNSAWKIWYMNESEIGSSNWVANLNVILITYYVRVFGCPCPLYATY